MPLSGKYRDLRTTGEYEWRSEGKAFVYSGRLSVADDDDDDE